MECNKAVLAVVEMQKASNLPHVAFMKILLIRNFHCW